MRIENQKMKSFLKENGIKCVPRYTWDGSMRGTWMLYQKGVKWWDNFELQNKLTSLGFKDFQNEPLSNFSGNGGMFSVPVIAPYELTEKFLNGHHNKMCLNADDSITRVNELKVIVNESLKDTSVKSAVKWASAKKQIELATMLNQVL